MDRGGGGAAHDDENAARTAAPVTACRPSVRGGTLSLRGERWGSVSTARASSLFALAGSLPPLASALSCVLRAASRVGRVAEVSEAIRVSRRSVERLEFRVRL